MQDPQGRGTEDCAKPGPNPRVATALCREPRGGNTEPDEPCGESDRQDDVDDNYLGVAERSDFRRHPPCRDP